LEGVTWKSGCFAQDSVGGDGDKLEAAQFYRCIEQKIAQAQRRGHKRQAKRLHRRAARRRRDALHKFSRKIVDQYQTIIVGDISSLKNLGMGGVRCHS
jgi:putative transposase